MTALHSDEIIVEEKVTAEMLRGQKSFDGTLEVE